MDKMMYKTADKIRRRKLRQCTNVADPEDLRAEFGAARLLASEAIEQRNFGLSNLILNTVGKLCKVKLLSND